MNSIVIAFNICGTGFVSKFMIILPLCYSRKYTGGFFELLITVQVESLAVCCREYITLGFFRANAKQMNFMKFTLVLIFYFLNIFFDMHDFLYELYFFYALVTLLST